MRSRIDSKESYSIDSYVLATLMPNIQLGNEMSENA